MGSLVAAVASFVRARQQGGEWLLRIEDLDPPREQAGASELILRSLETHGFVWDRSVYWQSQRHDAYQSAIAQLKDRQQLYACSCSREQIRRIAQTGIAGLVYPGTCRIRPQRNGPTALRFRLPDCLLSFQDICQGPLFCNPASDVGDVVIRRKDGLTAYVLACVVDDAASGITEIVRGDDILSFTPAQICLQKSLGLSTPAYAHIPVLRGADGNKLSKQFGAPPIDDKAASQNLLAALAFLELQPPVELQGAEVTEIWNWVWAEASAVLPDISAKTTPRDLSDLTYS
jgi:glutamyl-Q tRNA(Asp) synthetase